MVAGGVVTGFVLFLFSDVVRAFGLSETIPVPLAAWAPAGASLLLGITVLLHLEDG
jgi:lipopolysaccharide export system permease protein